MAGLDDPAGILAAQSADGSFPALVHLSQGTRADHNGFVTALVLECLWQAGDAPVWVRARNRALDFLQSCGSDGRFGFYPRGAQPDWMTGQLPDDADDTALFTRALFYGGRIGRADARATVLTHLRPHQKTFLTERDDPWHRVGSYQTWLDETAIRNPVDCTVNANILALMQEIGGDWTEAAAITEMLYAGVDWAGTIKARMAKLSPWYPDPGEFVQAVRRAAQTGEERLQALVKHLETLPWVQQDNDRDLPVCGSSDGRIVWTCPVLSQARAFARNLA